jgi:putative aminopeptidase FrvX
MTDQKMTQNNELLDFLKQMISQPGLSGHETPVRSLIEAAWQPLTDEWKVSRLGSLHGLRRGSLPEPRPSLLLAAHMDAIGLIVTSLVDGFLHVTGIGGLDARVLPGQVVTVHGREDLPAVIVQPPAHLLPDEFREKSVPLEHLLVDTGLLPSQVQRLVRPGDLVSYAQPPLELSSDAPHSTEYLVGHSLDNRVSVAAVTACLQQLQGRQLAWDLWVVATTQEEVTLGGAATSAFALRPSLAVAIDVTFAASPGSSGYRTFPLGKGITLCWGANIHPKLHKLFAELADRLEIPWKMETAPRYSGTDAMALQVAAEGVPSMVIGIPLRYMHTPVEMVSLKDVTRTGRLLAEFAAQLDENFMQRLAWE